MHNRLKHIPDKKVPGRWLTNCPVDLGELSLRANWALLSPRAVHLSSSVLAKAIIKNRNSCGDMLSLYLTPTLNSMDVSNFPMIILTILLLHMHLIAEHSLGGAPYFSSMAISNALLEVSKALTRSVNSTHVGRLWWYLRCRSFLIRECDILASNSRCGSKLAFHAVFADYLE